MVPWVGLPGVRTKLDHFLILGLLALLTFQLLGEALRILIRVPIPGPSARLSNEIHAVDEDLHPFAYFA